MKKLIILISLILSYLLAQGQGGANVYAGLVTVNNINQAFTGSGEFHSGYSIGIRARLKDNKFVAGPGLKYTRFNLLSKDNPDFFGGQDHYHMLSVPFDIGLEYRLKYQLKLRLFTGVDAHYFYKIDKNTQNINLDTVNSYFFGSHAGIGIDISWITFDLIYEYGLSNAHKQENSRYNWLSFAVGFFF